MMTALRGATPLVLTQIPCLVKQPLLHKSAGKSVPGEYRMILRRILAASIFLGALAATKLDAQPDYQLAGTALSPAPADPAIAAALAQVSPEHIRHTIETLVSSATAAPSPAWKPT
jgi:hypothetical protein